MEEGKENDSQRYRAWPPPLLNCYVLKTNAEQAQSDDGETMTIDKVTELRNREEGDKNN